MGLTVKSPYGPGGTVKIPPETITSELSKDGSKAKATYKSGIPSIKPGGGGAGGPIKTRAYTPGGPSGS
jgi:hypothetical protein